MDHKSIKELRQMLKEAEYQVTVGGKYAHYKDSAKLYTVTGLGILEATDEVAVKYAMLENPDIEFVRALNIWMETVEWDGQVVPRFKKV